MAQGGDEGLSLPGAEGGMVDQALAARRSAGRLGHVGLDRPSAGKSIPRIDCFSRLDVDLPPPRKFPHSIVESAQLSRSRRMRKSRFTETQIIGMIKEQEAGLPVADICRKHGVNPASFYKLKAKYGGMEVSDAQRLKSLEEENAKLKRLVADTMLDVVVLKDLLGKR